MKKATLLFFMIFGLVQWTFSQTLISTNSSWKYLDDGSNQNTAWRAQGFNDASWASGNAELGYGDGDEATVVSYGPDANNKYITTYFRKSFNVTNPGSVPGLNLDLLADDGAVVYLNGVELVRQNMPTGSINYLTTTPGYGNESGFTSHFGLPSGTLVSTNNILAVEVHQASGSSSDISFNLELSAGQPPGQPNVIRGPYLQTGTATSVIVKWRTNNSSDSKVTYGTSLGNLNQSVSSGTSTTEHAITLTGLVPNTKYYYTIGTNLGAIAGGSSGYSFTTSPVSGTNQPVRVWVLGDSGTANSNAASVRNAYENYVNSNNLHTDMIMMLGDNAYNDGTDSEYQAAVFNMYTAMLRKTVLWSCPGNHDYYGNINNYLNIFSFPTGGQAGGVGSGSERYYSYDFGNIHFISMDSHGSPRNVGGAQYNWLQNDLNNTTSDWIVAYWHHPAYSNGSHDSDSESRLIEMRENFLPLLESHGVDLVLSGHSHSYERTFLLKGHYDKSNTLTGSMILDGGDGNPSGNGAYTKTITGPTAGDGAVYITAGSSGSTGGVSSFPMMYTWQNALGSVVIETQGSDMRVRFLRSNGSFTDDFTLTKNLSNQAPVAQNDSGSSFQGIATTIDVLANDSDPNGSLDNGSVTVTSGPTKGTINSINPTTGEISYTPLATATGSDSFTYEVCDDGVPSPVMCDQATVNITILVNNPPLAVDDNANTNENTSVVIDVLANDSDTENNLDASSVQIILPPTSGTITNIAANGEVTYNPSMNFTGSDSFTYTVDDDMNETSNVATVNVNVLANVAPVANDDSGSTTEGNTVLISVFSNDTDLNGDLDPTNSNTTGLLLPLHGSTNFISGLGYEYVPAAGFVGYDQFEYRVCDMSNPTPLCDVASVTVFVDCAPSPGQNIISGVVYEDANEDQAYNYESGQGGVTVVLFDDNNSDGLVDGGDTQIDSDVTDSEGNFSFTVNPVFTTSGSTSVSVNNDLDDAWEKNNGDMENDKNEHETGKIETWNGVRFRNVNIPANAIITDARLVFESKGNEDNTPAAVNIYGELSTSPSVYNEVDYGISSRSKSTAAISWTFGEWVQDQFYQSPNVAAALQEIIDLNGWSAGNDLAFLMEGTGSQRRKYYAHDGGDGVVQLLVDYEVPGQASYDYVLEVDAGTLPVDASLTTDNVEEATMTAIGQSDCHNNFGFKTGPPNIPPTVNIVSPASGSFVTPQSFAFVANAADSDGTIQQVEFFIDGNSVGVGTEAPPGTFTSAVQNFDLNGTYSIVAVATDNRNDETTSASITITINIPNDPPTVSINSPLDGTNYNSAQTISVTAIANDLDIGLGGVIASIEFFANGSSIGVDNAAPYSASLGLTEDASISLTATATDGLGESATSAAVNITVNLPNVNPTVAITTPTNNTSYTSPQSVAIAASASDSDGSIVQVDFYVDGALLSTDNASPYEATYMLDVDGSYDITAVATDNEGGMMTSSINTITLLSAPIIVSYEIVLSDDDARQKDDGQVEIDKDHHEMGEKDIIGLRYQNVAIPVGATITEAYIVFTSSNKEDKNPSSVDIFGELNSNPAIFIEIDDNISDRLQTTSVVPWTFAPKWFEDDVYTSPDLTSVVQEIVNQQSWSSGNAMAFIIEATGEKKRKAYTFENDPSLTPKLFIEYQGGVLPYLIAHEDGEIAVNNATFEPVELMTEDVIERNKELPIVNQYFTEDKHEISNLLLYPNPTTGELNISFSVVKEQPAFVQIVSLTGNTVLTRKMSAVKGENKLVVGLDNFAKGAYIVIVKTGTKHISKTVILE